MSETTIADKRLDGLTAAQLRIVKLLRDARCAAIRNSVRASFIVYDPENKPIDTATPSVIQTLIKRELVRYDGRKTGVIIYAQPGEVSRLNYEEREKNKQRDAERRAERDAKLNEVVSAIERIAAIGTREELASALLRIESQGIYGY